MLKRTNKTLRSEAKRLAATAKEKDSVRRALAITAKRLAAAFEETKSANVKLRELNRLKDEFLSVTTHELRTPLIPIKSQAQLLLAGDYGELNREQMDAIEMIYRNEENLNKLTSEVLDIAKIKSHQLKISLQDAVLEEIIAESIKNVEASYEHKHISVSLLPVPELPRMPVDKLRIGQVMRNLLDNAYKFTPEKGKVVVEIKRTKDAIIIIVKDTGIGIDPKLLDKIFTPFFQIDSNLSRKYSGTGLGLAISKGIIEAHGGKIRVESAGEGKGSTFSFSLPIEK